MNPVCPTCQTPMLDAMIGVTVTVYQGPVEALMVRGWSCARCGMRQWREDAIHLPKLTREAAAR